jgi:hypothetical protein
VGYTALDSTSHAFEKILESSVNDLLLINNHLILVGSGKIQTASLDLDVVDEIFDAPELVKAKACGSTLAIMLKSSIVSLEVTELGKFSMKSTLEFTDAPLDFHFDETHIYLIYKEQVQVYSVSNLTAKPLIVQAAVILIN